MNIGISFVSANLNAFSEARDFRSTRDRMLYAREWGITFVDSVMFDIDAEGIETQELPVIDTEAEHA